MATWGGMRRRRRSLPLPALIAVGAVGLLIAAWLTCLALSGLNGGGAGATRPDSGGPRPAGSSANRGAASGEPLAEAARADWPTARPSPVVATPRPNATRAPTRVPTTDNSFYVPTAAPYEPSPTPLPTETATPTITPTSPPVTPSRTPAPRTPTRSRAIGSPPTATATATSAPATPASCRAGCAASASVNPPVQGRVTVTGRLLATGDLGVAGATMRIVVRYPSGNDERDAPLPTGRDGQTTVSFNLGNAPAGKPLAIDVLLTYDGVVYRTQTSVTP